VCAHPWHGAEENGGRDHPPLALWLLRPMPYAGDVEASCFATLPPAALMVRGIILTPCAARKPDVPPPPEGDGKAHHRGLPSEVTPPGKRPPGLLELVQPKLNGHVEEPQ
jgi:hypothetical protein